MASSPPILVAEDDQNDAFILKRALEEAGANCPVHFCGDGVEARSYFRGEGPYDDRKTFALPWLVITDLKMPKMDGMDLLKWLRGHPDYKIIPIVVLSASGQFPDIQEAYRSGANSYLVKPSGYNNLVEMMKLVLGYWRICETPHLLQLV
jgi:CheY-like chemotaxis protein